MPQNSGAAQCLTCILCENICGDLLSCSMCLMACLSLRYVAIVYAMAEL